MLTAKEFLRQRIAAVIEDAGGYVNDYSDELIEDLVTAVIEDPTSEIEVPA